MKNSLADKLSMQIATPADVMTWLEASFIQLSLNGLRHYPNRFLPNPGNFKIYMPESVLVKLLNDQSAIGAYFSPERPSEKTINDPDNGEIYLLWTTVHFTEENKLIMCANHAEPGNSEFYFQAPIAASA